MAKLTDVLIGVGATANDKKGDSLRAAFQKVNTAFTDIYTTLGIVDGSGLNLGAFEFNGSVMTTTDSTAIIIDQTTTVTSDLTVGGDIVPSVANGGNLGSLAKPFRSLFVSNNTVFLGGVPLSLEPGTNELRVNNVPISQTITYADIPNSPTVPADISDLTDTDGLLSGGVSSYNDLTDKPTLFSGSYNDLTNKPNIAGTYQFSVAADDSTQRLISTDEVIKFVGTNGITTASDAEGNITISKISELVSVTVPTIGGTASASEAGITYLSGGLSKWAIFTEGAFTVGEWTDVQPGWTVTDNNGFTDTIAGRGSFGAASFQTTVNDWPAPASGKTYVFTSPDYQAGYTNPIEITVGSNDWSFNNNGSVTFPDATVQTTAWTGVVDYNTLTNKPNLAETYQFSVAADDSTQRVISTDEVIKFVGAGTVTTGSDAEGNITITGSNFFNKNSITLTLNSDYTWDNWDESGDDAEIVELIPNGANRDIAIGDPTNGRIYTFINSSNTYSVTLKNGVLLSGSIVTTLTPKTSVTVTKEPSEPGNIWAVISETGKITNGAYTLSLGSDGKLTVPGDIVGYQTYVSENPADERVTIQPSGSVDKPFLFTTDQTAGTWERSSMELPSAETNKAVTLGFPHSNITTGYIYNQGTDTLSGTEFNNAFNIMANSTDVKISTVSGGGNKVWKFAQDGDITLPAGGDIVNSTGVGQLANRVESSWTVTAGTNTYSFTLPSDGTYTMWVKCNIPNGILVWNATASVSNTNVPAIGTQYAWNYTGGGTPISLSSIPDQIRGVAGTISTDATYAGTTSNRFDFGISNTSGASQTVYYGYTRI
jgi:hypothetical protein